MSLPDKLRAAGLNFEKFQDTKWLRGNFSVADDRTQGFFLYSEADELAGHSEYDFLSAVGPADDAANVKKACEEITDYQRGAIVIAWGQICVKIEIPEDLDAMAAKAHVFLVCQTADILEKKIFGGDAR